jgi:hypothetical protein
MKCPYPDCRRDYNDEDWPHWFKGFVDGQTGMRIGEQKSLNRVHVLSRLCRFCKRLFHEVSVGNEEWNSSGHYREVGELEFLVSYPPSKTKFESTIPDEVLKPFHEAERCQAVGAHTGASACLRKCIYALCDKLGATGRDYKEKITGLPVKKEIYRALLRQVKFLGDHMTKPDGNDYTKEQIDLALGALPLVIDDLYVTDVKVTEAEQILAKVSSKTSKHTSTASVIEDKNA